MNRKIPFHELATLLAGNCNITAAEAEDFIKNFFELLTQSLIKGETVKIKGIGIFAPSGDTDNPVTFTPDAEIADTINAPFAMFEPEEVNESLSNESFDEVDASDAEIVQEPEKEAQPVQTDVQATEQDSEQTVQAAEQTTEQVTGQVTVQTTEQVTEQATEHNTDQNAMQDNSGETQAEEATAAPVEEVVAEQSPAIVKPMAILSYPEEEEPDEYLHEPEQKSGAGFGWGFVIGMLVGLAIGACGVYFAIDYFFPTLSDSYSNIETEENSLAEIMPLDSVATPLEAITDTAAGTVATVSTAADSIKAQPTPDTTTKPAVQASTPKTVKDTVRQGYLLNDMAKKHYGNKCFWVYIYEENKSKIANPNRVSPGLELVIPPAEKYNIDSSNAASIKAANEKAGKILTKYPK